MRVKMLKKAVEEAKRFIEACEMADMMAGTSEIPALNEAYYDSPSHYVASAKRAKHGPDPRFG